MLFRPGLTLVPDAVFFKGLKNDLDFASQQAAGFMKIVVPHREFTKEEFAAEDFLFKAREDAVKLKKTLDRLFGLRDHSAQETKDSLSAQDAVYTATETLDNLLKKHSDNRKLEQIVCDLPESECVKVVGFCDKAQLKEIDELEKEGQKRKPVFDAIRARLDELSPLTWGGVTEGSRIL